MHNISHNIFSIDFILKVPINAKVVKFLGYFCNSVDYQVHRPYKRNATTVQHAKRRSSNNKGGASFFSFTSSSDDYFFI